ncbi:YbaK/EbsC family protein [Proteocatella sphenisci]|uniref:YbaK/EbsC family protein n=1 Tax=Proteocatella sphenisci TaxID=181070 RepID=UPI00048B1BA9|nr:YbaK/EbsC family protein [Proteocatella sphenisci]
MAIERAKTYLEKWGMDKKVMEFDVSSATVELAARALGCEMARIAKTLSFRKDEGCMLVVCAGDARIDNSKYKKKFEKKAKMLTPDEVCEMVGHDVGGVCPFGVKEGVEIFLDESLKRFDTVFPACGSSNSAIELTIAELEIMSGSYGWVDVCKAWESGE